MPYRRPITLETLDEAQQSVFSETLQGILLHITVCHCPNAVVANRWEAFVGLLGDWKREIFLKRNY